MALPEQPLPSSDRVATRAVTGLHVFSLRHLPGGGGAIAAEALRSHGIDAPPEVGRLAGTDPWLFWRSPSEWTLLTTGADVARGMLAKLSTNTSGLACAVDQSDGVLCVEVQGPHIDALLARLVDAASLPRGAGRATRARLADVAVSLLRHDQQRLWVLADRCHDHYLAAWLAYAAAALDMPT